MFSSYLSEKQRQSFNFHCTICFEAFHPEARPPVILPCGHTFLCAPCSKRITKCMECRTSLFYTPPEPTCEKVRNEEILTWSNTRRGPYSRSSPRPQSPQVKKKQKHPEQIPLPLPKNLLLISLMETAQMEAAAKRNLNNVLTKKKKKKKKSTYIKDTHQGPSSELLQLRTVASNASEGSTEVLLTGKIMQENNVIPTELSYSQNKANSYDEDAYNLSSSEDEDEIDDDFDDDDDRLITAIGAITSTCGTYAVVDKNGLLVLPRKPKDATEGDHTSSLKSSSSIVSSSVNDAPQTPPEKKGSSGTPGRRLSFKRAFKRQSSQDSNSQASEKAESSHQRSPTLLERTYSNPPLPYPLEYGAKIQVVCIDDGWVTLARNKGFLYVDQSQLVKVGGPEDRACEIEGMLVSLNQTRKDMAQRKELLTRVETNLVDRLHRSLQKPAPTFVLPTDKSNSDETSHHEEENKERKKRLDALHLASPKPAKPRPAQLPDLNGLKIDTNDDSVHHLTLPHLSPSQNSPSHSSTSTPHSPIRMTISTPYRSPNRSNNNTAYPQSPSNRRRSMPSPVSPNQRVDFRTGLSGHHALSSSKPHSRYTPKRSSVRMMGDHRGLGSSTWNLLRRLGSTDANDSSNGSGSGSGSGSGRPNILCMSQSATSSIPEGES